MRSRSLISAVGWLCLMACAAGAQQKPAMTASAKLANARSAYLKRAGASDVAWNVISSGVEGWGRYMLVDAPGKADIIIEISQPEEGGLSVGGTNSRTTPTGQKGEETTSSTRLSMGAVKLVVADAKTNMPLWSGTEQPKFAMKQKNREDNVLQAAQRLVTRLRERVEPEP